LSRNERPDEISVISLPDAGIEPVAMMIKRRYTFITISTMFCSTIYIYFTNLAIEIPDYVGIVFRLFELWPVAIVVANAEVSWVDPSCAQSEKKQGKKQR